MISVSNNFKTAMKEPVKELDAYIMLDEETKITSADDLIQIKVSCEGGLCKTTMAKLEAKLIGDHDLLGKWVHVGYGVRLSDGTFEYLDYGSFLITQITTVKDTGITTIVGYDQMIKTMIKYNKLSVSYPISLFDYTKKLCELCGLELGNTCFGINMYDKSKTTKGRVSGDNSGNIYVDSLYKVSDYIPVEPLTKYTANYQFANLYNRIGYYDENKKCFSNNSGNWLNYFTTPENTKYVRFGKKNEEIDDFMLVKGDTLPDSYVKYNSMNDWQITKELWENIDGITYRDIFTQIAQVTGTVCIIGNDNKIYFKTIYDTKETLTYENMKTLKLEPKYGEINSVVLSRTPQEDNVYMRDEDSIKTNGLTEFKIENNEIVDKDRENAMQPIYDALHGISFYPFETNTEGLGWYEIGDKLEIDKDTDSNLLNIYNVDRIGNNVKIDKNDFITISYDNSQGSSTVYINHFTKNLNLKTNTKYNIIVEVKEVVGTGVLYSNSINGSQGQFKSSASYEFSNLKSGIKTVIRTTRETFNNITYGLRSYVAFRSGESGSITFRLSVLEDNYVDENNFVYLPYNANKYNCIILNKSITIDGGIKEILKASAETKTQTQYQYASTINKRLSNTEIIVNKQEKNITQLVSDMYDENGVVQENFTKVYQDITNIINSVQNSGGSNLLKNSVMFAYDNNNLPNDWTASGEGTLTISSSPEALINGSLSGHAFTLSNKKVLQRVNVKMDSSSDSEKTYYTFSTKIKKDITGTCYVRLYNANEEHKIELKEGESSFYGDYEIKALLPKDSYYNIEFYGSADSNATFTDNMFAIGEYKTQWSQSSGEIMNTQVNINVDGVLVKSSVYAGDYTIMSPLEFAGYSNINGTITKVFTLNKDRTYVKKLDAEDEINMMPIKIVPITSGDLQGWAFVPSKGGNN